MAYLKLLAVLTTVVSFCFKVSEGNIFTISDDRVRNLDITPVLGRGYSIMTNQYHSTCLTVDTTSVPSYNYDYFFKDFSKSTNKELDLAASFSGSFGFFGIKTELSTSASSTSKSKSTAREIVSTMRLERYYSSVREEISPLVEDAKALLEAEDYVGFFKACGPNYVRSIRRAQEITAIFKFSSSSAETASQFASGLKVSGLGLKASMEFSGKSKYNSITSSLEIKITGYGLGLSQEGSDTLIATKLDQYNEVMKFAFKSMTQSEASAHIGMVYGMELVPWVHNTAFQVAAKMQDENIIVPLPRSLIPKAFKIADPTDFTGFTNATRSDYRCKEISFAIDRYGYCCEVEALYDYTNGLYDINTSHERICKPVRNLDRSLVKDNMSNNGEFVSRLDSVMRYKLIQIAQLQKCISASHAIPSRFDYHYLKANDGVKYDRSIEIPFALLHLKRIVDPFNDFSIISHMAKELDEWIDKFYSPCYAALHGSNVGTTPDVDVTYFMAYPWHSHAECMYLSCLAPNMRWDRKLGGCIPSIVMGSNSPSYGSEEGDDADCASDVESDAAEEECKHDQAELHAYHTDANACWDTSVGTGSIDFFVTHYCNPQLTGEIMPQEDIDNFAAACERSSSGGRRLSEVEANATKTVEKKIVDDSILNLKKKASVRVDEDLNDIINLKKKLQ